MKLVGVFAVLSLMCSTLLAVPRTFVSALNGSDVNPCTRPLPCRSFTAAIAVTDADGEVIALDSGGYGVVAISFGVSIIAPSGVYAGITDFSGTAIMINAGDTAHVVLKNLVLNSQGGIVGIDVNTVAVLHVDACAINGFTRAIFFEPTTMDSRLDVSNSVIRRSATGIWVQAASAQATVDSVRLFGSARGIEADGSQVTVRNSVISGPGTYGVIAEPGSRITVENTVSTGNSYGYYANSGGVIILNRSMVTSNSTAGIVSSISPSAIYVSESTITGNPTGISSDGGGVVLSRCTDILTGSPPPPCPAGHFTNTLLANTVDGTFDGSYSSN
jgi:hypothetical protein